MKPPNSTRVLLIAKSLPSLFEVCLTFNRPQWTPKVDPGANQRLLKLHVIALNEYAARLLGVFGFP